MVSQRAVLLAASAAFLTACGTSRSLEIESSTSWSGTVTDGDNPKQTISGTGNTSLKMENDKFCWTIQKQTESGYLHVYGKLKAFIRNDRGGERETFAEFGGVAGCSSDL